jgi:hypothetical protein
MEKVKMFLFARWIATNYEGVLNTEDGYWYKEQLEHFNENVWINYLKNGTVEDTAKFLLESTGQRG